MNIRDNIRTRLDEQQQDLEDWFYQVQLNDAEAGAGVMGRSIAIASMFPEWTFWQVLLFCKETAHQGLSIEDLLRRKVQ